MTTAADSLKMLAAIVKDRSTEYTEHHEYWMGENNLPVETTEFQSRFGTLFEDFRDNLARPIVKSAETRIRITGFGDGTGLGAVADDIWDRNKMHKRHQQLHTETLVKGDGYVLVMPKADKSPGIFVQQSESCAILYDDIDPDEKLVALKHWVAYDENDDPFVRLNFYFPKTVERYISKRSETVLDDDFRKYKQYDGDGDWKTNHQVGQVPMFEFNANYDLTEGKGRSDLADAVGFIDAINKTFLDMLTASEYTAAPQRFATGVDIPLDPKTGEPVEAYKSGKQKLWTTSNEMAKFGQFTSGDMKGYRDSIDSLVDHLAFTTATPSYALMKTAQYPSGEALRSAEGPLRGRVQDHDEDFGPVWHDVMQAAMKIEGEEVEGVLLKQIVPVFLPVNAPFATKELMEELQIKAEVLGVPEEKLWKEAGYTADEIEEMKAMREEEANLGPDPLDIQAAALLAGAPTPEEEGGVINDGTVAAVSAEATEE